MRYSFFIILYSANSLGLFWGELEILGALPKPGKDLLRLAVTATREGLSLLQGVFKLNSPTSHLLLFPFLSKGYPQFFFKDFDHGAFVFFTKSQ